MGKLCKIFCPVAIFVLFAPAFSLFQLLSSPDPLSRPVSKGLYGSGTGWVAVGAGKFAVATVPHKGAGLQSILHVNAQQETRGQKPDAQDDIAEILTPFDWVARGACWSFSGKIIAAQGVYVRGLALFYYNKRTFADFVFEVKLNKLAEDGSFGLLIRYDEKTKEGYTYLLFPHGSYGFYMLKNERDSSVFSEPATNMNKDTNIWNTIKIVCRGAKFDLYMNDHWLTSIIDHAYASGRVGFFLGSDPRQKALFEIVTLKRL